jgi:hypothetical protein
MTQLGHSFVFSLGNDKLINNKECFVGLFGDPLTAPKRRLFIEIIPRFSVKNNWNSNGFVLFLKGLVNRSQHQLTNLVRIIGCMIQKVTSRVGQSGGTCMSEKLRYHHIGIPTKLSREGEVYLERFKMYASGFDISQFGVEWLRFDPDAPFPELVKTVPHVAFVVDDLEAAIGDKEILIPPNRPSEGITVAFIVDNGAPIEFLQFDGPEYEVWPGSVID